MRPSGLVAGLGLLLVVPAGIAVALVGYSRGYYPYTTVPVVVAGVLVVLFAGLFLVLPRLRQFEANRGWR